MLVPPQNPGGPVTGRVISHHGLRVRIAAPGGVVEWKPPRRESWVVGDIVVFDGDRPKTIEPRANELVRVATGKGKRQALAANLDWLVIVTACGDWFKPGLVDRFIVAAGHGGIRSMVALNKTDLEGADECAATVAEYARLGYPVHCVSALTSDGVDALAGALAGSVSALVGHSGVGKTSLLNRLVPGADMAVGEAHEASGRGRHTTTTALMVELPGGGALIDSPGIRQFAPSGLDPMDVADHFPGFSEHTGQCKFRDCLHETEPGCAVRNAKDDGAISEELYASYLRLLASVKEAAGPAWKRDKGGS